MIAAWTIGILINTKSNFGLVTARMGEQSTLAQARVNALSASTNRMAGFARAGVSAFNTLAIGAAAATAIGIKGAADLQDAMAQTAVAMGRSTADIDRLFGGLALSMSNRTAQSVTQSMELIRTLATSGINDPEQLKALAMPIALYADTQFLGKNPVAFNDSAALAAKLAHQFGARTSAQMTPILNTLFKISQDMPDSLNTAATQLGYYAASYTAAGVAPTEVLQLQATLDRMGYGSRQSGRGMQMALRYLQNPTKKMGIAQADLGIGGTAFLDHRAGTFNVEGMIARLHADYVSAVKSGTVGGDDGFNARLARAFPANAVQIIGALASNAGVAQRQNVRKTIHRVADMEQAQAQLMNTLNNQTRRLATNFQSLATQLENPFIGKLTTTMGKLADVLGGMSDFLKDHPRSAMLGGGIMTGMGVYGASRVLSMGHMALRGFAHVGGMHLGMSEYGVGHAAGEGGAIGRFGSSAFGIARGGVEALLAGVGGMMTLPHLRAALGGMVSRMPLVSSNMVRASAGVDSRFMAGFMGDMMKGLGLTKLANPLRIIGTLGEMAATHVGLFAEGLAKLGARAIPIVGEVLLVADALKLLMTHSKNLGQVIGSVAGWIWYKGIPMIGNGLKGIILGAVPLAVAAMKGLVSSLIFVLNPANWGSAIANFAKGFGSSFAAQGPAAGAAAAKAKGGGDHKVAYIFNYHAAPGDDATQRRHALEAHRKMADTVAANIASAGRTLSRAAGQVIQSDTMSHWETAAGTA